MTYNTWTISPLLLATATVDRSQGLLYRDIGVKIESGVLAFLLDNGEGQDPRRFGRLRCYGDFSIPAIL